MTELAGLAPRHFLWQVADGVATIRLNRPERKNPLTFDSYAELRDTFRALPEATDVDVVVLASNGGNFCSGGDVHEIIGPLVGLDMKGLLAFTRMTGDLVRAMLNCGKPVSRPWTACAPGPAPFSPWLLTSAWRLPRRAVRFSSRGSAWPDATWARARSCRGSSDRGGRRNCSTPAG